jgi:adenine-specific DNA-methyltransferase
LRYIRYLADFPAIPLTSVWTDTGSGSFLDEQLYVVQTVTKVIARCLLMTTDPGDLVLDPTCGSGTTAFVAEQWGRRWITIDSSRVAVAVARQRLMTACFETYKTNDHNSGVDPNRPLNPKHGFIYQTIPHITLKSIAQNKGLDPLFAKHDPILMVKLKELNGQGLRITKELRAKSVAKLLLKIKEEKWNAVTEADERRWILPGTDPALFQQSKGGLTAKQVADLRDFASALETEWKEWQVPFDTDPDWPKPLQEALSAYRQSWGAKMDEINKAIDASAEQEELVDKPEIINGVVRVSGAFTVESVRPPEDSLKGEDSSPIDGEAGALETFDAPDKLQADNAASHIDRMLSLLKEDGITFLGNKFVKLSRVDRIESSFLHAEGEFTSDDGQEHRVAIAIGPEHGSVPAFQVEETMRLAHRRGYDDLVIAGFSFDAGAQRYIQEHNDDPATKLRIHMAQIRPDVTMGDLLKKTHVSAQIFTVFGQPRTKIENLSGGEVRVSMEGVDIYDPVKNIIDATNANKVAAWFLDTDYDGQTFCICQAFFPDKDAWKKIARALKSDVEEGAFEALSGTVSLPFKPGTRNSIAVKVIDPRGNEVMRVHRLGTASYGKGSE